MALSNELISQFVKMTKDDNKESKETTLYGTTVEYNSSIYVKLDGSDQLTPIATTTDMKPGERVAVLIKNHNATVMGNMSSPSARTEDVSILDGRVTEISDKISEFEIIIADKVTTEDLEAINGRIDTLVSEDVTIKNSLTAAEADIDTLQTDNVTIKNSLTAAEADIDDIQADNIEIHKTLTANKADIDSLKTTKLDATVAEITYAEISDLEATNANITNIESDLGEFKNLTTDTIAANTASIENLEANKLSASDIEGKFANIDFSNISKATMQYFYSASGLIKDVIIGDTTITGKLVGVTISGDLIEGNTVKAEKLVIKGTDGLYYKLNTNGIKTEAEQTDYNSLDGQVIKAKSITATKISVEDLVAFDATIGGFNITESAIYSGVKESVDNTTNGLYMDKTGQLALGDASNFIKYYKDQNGDYHLEISASNVLMSTASSSGEGENKTVEQAIEELYETSNNTAYDLSNYISATNAELENLQTQVDGSITTWFYDYEPTTSNLPASEWTTSNAKNIHLGDLFYNTETGYCYRWQVLNNVHSWNLVKDVDITKAIADSSKAQDTADEKRRVFVSTPTVPYDIGDLWVQGYSGDILKCSNAKTESQTYNSADWTKASKYTDDTKANAAQEGINALVTRMSTAETEISQNKDDILLRATKTEVETAKSEAISTAATDATTKANSALSSAKTYADAQIQVSADEISSTVESVRAIAEGAHSDIDNLSIGGRNYVKDSDVEQNITGYYRTYKLVDAKENLQDKTVTVSFDAMKTEGSAVVNMYAYFRGSSALTPFSNKIGDVTSEYKRYSMTIQPGASMSDATHISIHVTVTGSDVYVKNVKVEIGNKATDWSPAPEDMATSDDFDTLQSSSEIIEERVVTAESMIQQLSNAISTLVTDGNGVSLMVQTDDGWKFSTAEIQSIVDATSEGLNNLNNEVGDVSSTVDALQQAVTDLGVLNDYVKIGTYEDEPCIELGESDSDFKLTITNTRIMFMEGSIVPAYINNHSLFIRKAVIEEELVQGEFVWKTRSNGNLGLVWKGATS